MFSSVQVRALCSTVFQVLALGPLAPLNGNFNSTEYRHFRQLHAFRRRVWHQVSTYFWPYCVCTDVSSHMGVYLPGTASFLAGNNNNNNNSFLILQDEEIERGDGRSSQRAGRKQSFPGEVIDDLSCKVWNGLSHVQIYPSNHFGGLLKLFVCLCFRFGTLTVDGGLRNVERIWEPSTPTETLLQEIVWTEKKKKWFNCSFKAKVYFEEINKIAKYIFLYIS